MVLALFGTESLHGLARTRLESAHHLDREKRLLAVDASTQVGRDLSKLFTGFLIRELTLDGFHVERLERIDAPSTRSNASPSERD